jgi:hypothetical protein
MKSLVSDFIKSLIVNDLMKLLTNDFNNPLRSTLHFYLFTKFNLMKKNFMFLICLCVSGVEMMAQTTHIVCNTPGYNNGVTNTIVYNNLQTCIDASSAGDIIYVQGSGVSYGDITIKKPLMLIGPGYFLGHNALPNSQALSASATIANLTMDSTSTCLIKGFIIGNAYIKNSGNIIIQNNYITGTSHFQNTANCVFKSNYVGSIHAWYDVWTNNSGMTVSNNIVFGATTLMNAVVTNNILNADYSDYEYQKFSSCSIRGNIFGTRNYYSSEWNGNDNSSFSNNIFLGDIFGLGAVGGNQIGVEAASLFVGFPTANGYSLDARYQLKSSSVGVGAAQDGGDCGAFGGSEPYKLSGIGFNPNIFKVEMPNTGTSQGGLPVRILIQSNQ